jgi:DNA-directed RNA polymerase specialized sigma24 family protein
VTALYAEHALGLTRLAHVMLGDRPTAEDVVHDAFAGLYRNWHRLDEAASPARPAERGGRLRIADAGSKEAMSGWR